MESIYRIGLFVYKLNIFHGNSGENGNDLATDGTDKTTYLFNNNIDTDGINGEWDGEDNIYEEDPGFYLDTYHLMISSPCKDEGTDGVSVNGNFYDAPEIDIDGEARPNDGDIDIGAVLKLGRSEMMSGGRRKDALLADALEAVIAAIYLDGGFHEAKDFIMGHLKPFFSKINVNKFFINNYKSALQEYFQKESLPAPNYKMVTTKGPDHKKQFTVEVFLRKSSLAKATGRSKKERRPDIADG